MSQFQRPSYEDIEREPLIKLVSPSAKKILDIGCNKGGFGFAIKKLQNAEVWGIEPDQGSATVARERLDHVIADYFHEDNPIPDTYFDLITFNDSLEHMIDPVQALKLAKKKLNTKGKIHCCVPNIRHIDNLEHLIFEKDWHYEESGIRDRTHLRFFTEKSIIKLFKDNGFNIIKTIGINESWWDSERKLRNLFFRFLPSFTSDMRYIQIVVIAEPIENI